MWKRGVIGLAGRIEAMGYRSWETRVYSSCGQDRSEGYFCLVGRMEARVIGLVERMEARVIGLVE